jgi:hypothetical protein
VTRRVCEKNRPKRHPTHFLVEIDRQLLSLKFKATSVFFFIKKFPQVKDLPIGEKSRNLATLFSVNPARAENATL